MSSNQRVTVEEADLLPTVLRTIVGSVVHGTALPGLGDIDQMGIAIESRADVLGTGSSPASWGFRSAWHPDDGVGHEQRSQPGDIDLIIYPARKWARLALAGNPSVVAPLFVDESFVLTADEFGAELRAERHRFASRNLAIKHAEYMRAQRAALLNQRGMKVSRPELVEAYGYDTKFAGHMLRLGYQGLAVLEVGDLPIPLDEGTAEIIVSVRRGERELAWVLEEADRLQAAIDGELEQSGLPEFSDSLWLDDWLARAQLGMWAKLGEAA